MRSFALVGKISIGACFVLSYLFDWLGLLGYRSGRSSAENIHIEIYRSHVYVLCYKN
jgi:hypothetical protein